MAVMTEKQPKQGRQTVTTTAKPLTQIGASSSAAITFAKQNDVWRATDGAAWDLSSVAAGYIAKTATGWKGRIKTVNNAGNYVGLYHWEYDGAFKDQRAAAQPSDGDVVTIHKMEMCDRLIVDALDANTNDIYLGMDSTVTADGANPGHPIAASASQPNHRLVIEAGIGKHIDLTEVYVIVASGTEGLSWIGS